MYVCNCVYILAIKPFEFARVWAPRADSG
eukprot:COSAG02_NODE_7058_length_3205_cov_1.679652_1_plen_28_part_10